MATRGQLRTDVLNLADAYGSPRWDVTAGGEVDRRLGMVHAREWKAILQAAPYYQISQLTPTTDPNGVIPLSALSTGSGDTLQQMYRILGVWFNNFRYEYVEARNWLQTAIVPIQDFVWFRSGSAITVPGAPSTQATAIFVNWWPQRFDQLSSDSVPVGLPPDYDDIFALAGAARLLMKGAAETEASAALKAEAAEARADLLADLARISTDPQTIGFVDNPLDWGE